MTNLYYEHPDLAEIYDLDSGSAPFPSQSHGRPLQAVSTRRGPFGDSCTTSCAPLQVGADDVLRLL
jgi:hypothetical protein